MKNLLSLFLALVVQSALPVLAQRSIRFGENLRDSIACQSTDTFTFAADANDFVVVHVVELSDFGGVCRSACLCFDQLVELRDADNLVLADASSPTSGNSPGRYRTQVGSTRMPVSGTYTLSIRDKQNDGRGEYRLFIQRVNAPEQTELIHSGESRLSSLNSGAVATFRFDAQPGDRAIIDMTASEIGNLVPRLALYAPSGQAIALPDTGSIDIALDDGGFYTLLAFSKVDQSGSYQLSLEVEPCQSDVDCLHLPCTTATCNLQTGRCEQTVNSGHCLIDEPCFVDGDHNPDNECEVCSSEIDSLGWTPATSGTPCGDQTDDECTDPDSCDAAVCLANDVVCDDENVCNGIETCDPVDGCRSGTSLDCDDGIPCTVDDCNPITGCTHTPNSPCCEVVCNDSDPCTTDSCSNGTCAFTPVVCDDNNVCTTDACNPSDGSCQSEVVVCSGGQVCDPGTGACVPCIADSDCDDADICNGQEACPADNCVPGAPLDCDDDDLCTADSCDPISGCANTPQCVTDNDCSDADLCTTDLCNDGCCENVAIECPNSETCTGGECEPLWELDISVNPSSSAFGFELPPTLHIDGSVVRVFVAESGVICDKLCPPESCDGRCIPAPSSEDCPSPCVFRDWSDPVEEEKKHDNPLEVPMDSDKAFTANFQAVECIGDSDCGDGKSCTDGMCVGVPCIPNPGMCGACGDGACIGMIVSLFGWVGLRFVSTGSRRRDNNEDM